MSRYTEYHNGVAVIADKAKIKEAMAKLARMEDMEEAFSPGSFIYEIKEQCGVVKRKIEAVCSFRRKKTTRIIVIARNKSGKAETFAVSEYGKTFFRTEDEAKAAVNDQRESRWRK